ncbi:uncharacterized protein LOC107657502 isoform X3 [Sinocyclocheilus anshuiensis]|uniref:uncharacterized protein LOC107657502 isoform X3 n=1 Tax=Sinocyclocheilus anshuiensis TaxID=1608454 RepID=UPI0007BA0963|nr:PREDICTED: uncharacterized protein LOC107657502 isoform X3 [Sinocyclocheilus anshuiensis]
MEEIILDNKPKLIKWLSSDSELFLQYVQAKKLITMSQYSELMDMAAKERVIIRLLDIILGRGESVCRKFLDLLKEDDVNEISPELREWIRTVDTKDQKTEKDCKRRESGDRPIQDQKPDRDCQQRPIQDCQMFLKKKFSLLVQNVKNIDPIIDDLVDLHAESVANVRAKSTDQEKMRKLLGCVNCESIAKDLVIALYKHEKPLMNDLQNNY